MISVRRSIGFKGCLAIGFLGAGLVSSGVVPRAQALELATAAQSSAAPAANYQAGINEVLKLVDAKLDSEVIKAYIKSSPVAYSLSASEIIALKDRGVPQDVIAAILQRGGELRAEATMRGPYAGAPPPAAYPTYPYSANPYSEFEASGAPVYPYPADYSGYGYPIYPQTYYPWYYSYYYTSGYPYYGCYGYPYYGCYGHPYHCYGYPYHCGYFHNFHDFHHNDFNHNHLHNFNTPHTTQPGMTARMFPHNGFNNHVGFAAAGRVGTPATFASHGSFAPAARGGFAVRGGGGGGFHGGGGHR
jgi:hypothetical protein